MDKQWLVDLLFDCQTGRASCRWTAQRIIEEHEKIMKETQSDRRPTEVA